MSEIPSSSKCVPVCMHEKATKSIGSKRGGILGAQQGDELRKGKLPRTNVEPVVELITKNDTCVICSDKYNKNTRKILTCPLCEKEACRKCMQRYFVSTQTGDFHCMFCRETVPLDFIYGNFPKKWINSEFNKYRGDYLFGKEEEKFHLMQPRVGIYKHSEQLQESIQTNNKEIVELRRQIREIQGRNSFVRDMVRHIKESNYTVDLRGVDTDEEHRKYVAAKSLLLSRCQDPECNGLLDPESFNCNTCDKKTCKRCHSLAEDNHQCNQEDLDTVALLQKDTKPCPKCSTGVYKIEGCDQMFCTCCKTVFSWKSGKILTKGTFHNPHYFEWLRDQSENGEIPRQPGDVPGALMHPPGEDDQIHEDEYLPFISKARLWENFGCLEEENGIPECKPIQDKDASMNIKKLEQVIDEMERVNHYVRRSWNTRVDEARKEDMRLRFLTNRLTQEKFKEMLLSRDKTLNKAIALKNVYTEAMRSTVSHIQSIKPGQDLTPVINAIFCEWKSYDALLHETAKNFGSPLTFDLHNNLIFRITRTLKMPILEGVYISDDESSISIEDLDQSDWDHHMLIY